MSKNVLEKNFSGSDLNSSVGANWKNARCYPAYRPSSSTARLIWRDPSSFYYPPDIPSKYRVHGAYGTLVLIADNIACSAGHCFDVGLPGKDSWVTPFKPGTRKQLMPYELATLMSVQFNYELDCNQGDEDTAAIAKAEKLSTQFNILELLEHRHGGLDYAVFKLSGNPGSIYGVAKIAIKEINFTVTIPQHPAGLPKKLGQGYAACADNQCSTLQHYVDTLGGSSGSGIFYNAFLVGIHTRGDQNVNGGVSMIALFKASGVIRDIVLKDSGLYKRYYDSSEFIRGFLLGALVAGGVGGLYSVMQEKYSTSKKALITAASGITGGVVLGIVMHEKNKSDVMSELAERPQYDGLQSTN